MIKLHYLEFFHSIANHDGLDLKEAVAKLATAKKVYHIDSEMPDFFLGYDRSWPIKTSDFAIQDYLTYVRVLLADSSFDLFLSV